jgi:hypothetical protein
MGVLVVHAGEGMSVASAGCECEMLAANKQVAMSMQIDAALKFKLSFSYNL